MFPPSTRRLLALAVALPSLVCAGFVPLHDFHDHSPSPTIAKHLPPGTKWYHPRDHPAHRLFARQATNNSTGSFPSVGSPAWSAAYPTTTPDSSQLPQAWVNALNEAVQAGKIPNIPPSTLVNGNPTYPSGYDPLGSQVCSGTYKCRNPDDIWDAPEGILGSGFDDGPTEFSPTLYSFLKNNSVKATHFMIGINILWNPTAFEQAYVTNGDDIAVHTYTHPYMTTLSNIDLVAQFGWTMQILYDSTAGKVPRYWRPPYGDTDERVRAIALEVFGLTTIVWNQDTEDWSLTTGGTTMQAINQSMTQWLTGTKSPGLIILEHELSAESVQAYMDAYPVMIQNGWKLQSVSEIQDGQPFRSDGGILDVNDSVGATSSTTSSSATSSSSSTSASSSHPASTTGTSSTLRSSATGTVGATHQSSAGSRWPISSALLACVAGLFFTLA
ncbi:carbohydrate esterase family 4 protein [Neolentinus lepideus HHB14362 ss-1]|uniref:chitin deacetylase n=1 Tax=Neolentinus lepideus HHB14362 ss-1 TaxID=1314782 RepID=A0A165RZV0_9AGAM|nr:carbohydrate esterase family 4 protein [Neolentinus lepideus HHB14362 ss-1]